MRHHKIDLEPLLAHPAEAATWGYHE
jgi:hypothetical protein